MFTMTVQSSLTTSIKEQVKRKFVTSHQLQQEQQRKKNKQKSPELPRRILSPRKFNMPVSENPGLEERTVNPKEIAGRKLNLQGDKIHGKSTGKNDIAVKVVIFTYFAINFPMPLCS